MRLKVAMYGGCANGDSDGADVVWGARLGQMFAYFDRGEQDITSRWS